jgi:hypothetical protein
MLNDETLDSIRVGTSGTFARVSAPWKNLAEESTEDETESTESTVTDEAICPLCLESVICDVGNEMTQGM